MTERWLSLPVIASLTLGGCISNVPLAAPPPGAPFRDRLASYQELSPAGAQTLTTISVSSTGAVSTSSSTQLVLHGGQVVADPTDLIPVVGDTSVTAVAARRSSSARHAALGMFWGGLVTALTGSTVATLGLASSLSVNQGGGGVPSSVYVGGGLLLAGLIVATVGGLHYARIAGESQLSAFTTYDRSLRERLRVCVAGMALVDCDAPPPPPPADPTVPATTALAIGLARR